MFLLREVFAAQTPVNTTAIKPNLGFTNLSEAFGLVINIILAVGVALTVVFLIIGGIQYITSRGDQKAAESARKTLTNAVIGFIVVIGAFTLKSILTGAINVQNATGLNSIVNL